MSVLASTSCLYGQEGNTKITTDSTVISDSIETLAPVRNPRDPKTATIMSAVLPGLGQAYNRSYWKIPIVYALGGVLIYFLNDNQKYYKELSQAYRDTLYLTTVGTKDPRFAIISDSINLKNRIYKEYIFSRLLPERIKLDRDNFRRNRDLNIIALMGVYLLNVIDAHVDAHLKNFDINDNLSLDIKPKMDLHPLAPPGFSLTLTCRFKK